MAEDVESMFRVPVSFMEGPEEATVEAVEQVLCAVVEGRRVEAASRDVEWGALLAAASVDRDLLLRVRGRLVASRLHALSVQDVSRLADRFLTSYDVPSCSVGVAEYLAATRELPEHLALRFVDVDAGRVPVDSWQLCFLVARAVKLANPVEALVAPDWVHEAYHHPIKEARKLLESKARQIEALRGGTRQPESYPPCIKKWLQDVTDGAEIGHVVRFNLTAFLNAIGVTDEEQVDLFRHRRDFDEHRTRYQVRHITEPRPGRGAGAGYLPMACRQIRGRDACPDLECPGPTPLLRYARLRGDAS